MCAVTLPDLLACPSCNAAAKGETTMEHTTLTTHPVSSVHCTKCALGFKSMDLLALSEKWNALPRRKPLGAYMGRHVVCTAVLYQDGNILVGPRHFDAVMLAQYKKLYATGEAPGEDKSVQGFIDQHGVFMDRKEALAVAVAACQIKRKTAPVDRLFSEDLY